MRLLNWIRGMLKKKRIYRRRDQLPDPGKSAKAEVNRTGKLFSVRIPEHEKTDLDDHIRDQIESGNVGSKAAWVLKACKIQKIKDLKRRESKDD